MSVKKVCIFPGCEVTNLTGIRLHNFPQQAKWKNIWLDAIGDREHRHLASSSLRRIGFFICERHFAAESYVNQNSEAKLLPNAIPLKPPQPLNQQTDTPISNDMEREIRHVDTKYRTDRFEDVSPLACPVCSRGGFANYALLDHHLTQSHTLPANKRFVCPYCERHYQSHRVLRYHVNTFHKFEVLASKDGWEVELECTVTGCNFATNSHTLLRHHEAKIHAPNDQLNGEESMEGDLETLQTSYTLNDEISGVAPVPFQTPSDCRTLVEPSPVCHQEEEFESSIHEQTMDTSERATFQAEVEPPPACLQEEKLASQVQGQRNDHSEGARFQEEELACPIHERRLDTSGGVSFQTEVEPPPACLQEEEMASQFQGQRNEHSAGASFQTEVEPPSACLQELASQDQGQRNEHSEGASFQEEELESPIHESRMDTSRRVSFQTEVEPPACLQEEELASQVQGPKNEHSEGASFQEEELSSPIRERRLDTSGRVSIQTEVELPACLQEEELASQDYKQEMEHSRVASFQDEVELPSECQQPTQPESHEINDHESPMKCNEMSTSCDAMETEEIECHDQLMDDAPWKSDVTMQTDRMVVSEVSGCGRGVGTTSPIREHNNSSQHILTSIPVMMNHHNEPRVTQSNSQLPLSVFNLSQIQLPQFSPLSMAYLNGQTTSQENVNELKRELLQFVRRIYPEREGRGSIYTSVIEKCLLENYPLCPAFVGGEMGKRPGMQFFNNFWHKFRRVTSSAKRKANGVSRRSAKRLRAAYDKQK